MYSQVRRRFENGYCKPAAEYGIPSQRSNRSFRYAGKAPHRFFLERSMIRQLKSGQYRLYSRKKDPKTGRRRNLGTFRTRKSAEAQERAVQYFKRH
jgi:hypothetical protein